MSEFLAPLDDRRAKDILRALEFYTAYTPEGAMRVAALLRERYPTVFARSEQKTFPNGALLLEMPGANITDPLVFVSHLDSLHGRLAHATPDMLQAPLQRAHVVALLEALDALLLNGYRPGGDLYLAFSMDGLSGGAGARAIAEYLAKRKISPCFVLDHGGYATHAAFCRYLPPGAPLALIGVTEKGWLEGRLIAPAVPSEGSRATPRPLNALLRSGGLISRRPSHTSLCRTSGQMLAAIARHAPLFPRMLIGHPRLTFPLLRVLWRKRAIMAQFFTGEWTATGIRVQGEPYRSPVAAELSFAVQTMPGRRLQWWKRRLRTAAARAGATLEIAFEHEASAPSQTRGEAWIALVTAVEILFERAVIVPCVCPGITDGRFYSGLKGKVYRFSPFLLGGEEALRGECTVDSDALQTAVQFFRQMLSV